MVVVETNPVLEVCNGRGASVLPAMYRWCVFFAMVGLMAGCDLVPSTPDGVFTLYRDRMKSGNLDQARPLLSDESKKLALTLTSEYKLKQPPENLALLNALDPASVPTVLKTTDTLALINVRTLKGGARLVRLVRPNADTSWKIDISEELSAFRSFLQAQQALDMIREQAGEYAASWKAFNDKLGRINVIEPPAPPPEPMKAGPPKQVKKEEPKPRKGTKQGNKQK